jgi:hypothetical protein
MKSLMMICTNSSDDKACSMGRTAVWSSMSLKEIEVGNYQTMLVAKLSLSSNLEYKMDESPR